MRQKTTYAFVLVLAAAALIVSACGGSSDTSGGAPASEGSSDAQTVSVRTISGVGAVLVDADGAALYAADQEATGMVVCTDSCTTIWDPLTVSSGDAPSAGDGIGGRLGVVERPDGARQVTFNGRLLYRFVEDPAPGAVTGNGLADTFEGQAFIWHVATPNGVSMSSANSVASGDGYDR
jgi:predicted lipoprotein with Yx(FWY)xxD motif